MTDKGTLELQPTIGGSLQVGDTITLALRDNRTWWQKRPMWLGGRRDPWLPRIVVTSVSAGSIEIETSWKTDTAA